MNKRNLTIGAFILLGLLFFWCGRQLNRSVGLIPPDADSFFSYVIPKLKSFIPNISLLNRTFEDRRKLLPKANLSKPQEQAKAATPTPTPSPTAQPTVTAKTPATSRVINPELRVNTIGGDTDPLRPTDSETLNPTAVNSGVIRPQETPTVDAQIGEWKMKIYRSPIKETLNELIFEYESGKIQKSAFYLLLDDLMRDSNPDIQRLAVYALAATPSYDSLVALLNNKEHLSPEIHDMIKVAFDGYSKPERLKILDSALKSDSHPIILGTLPLVIKAAQRMSLWQADYSSTTNSRERRGATQKVPKDDLKSLIETLQALERSSNTQIAQAALEALNQMDYRPTTASRDQ